jgi:hypothetical protein
MLWLGMCHQRVFELAGRTHGTGWNGAVIAGDEIHQAEIQRFDVGQARDLPCLAQSPGRFDQHVDGDFAIDAVPASQFAQRDDLFQRVVGMFRFGQHDIGDTFAGLADDGLEFFTPCRMPHVVDAHADAAENVFFGQDQSGDHVRMFALLPRGRTVLAIGGDVENRLRIDRKFRLYLERLLQQLFAAGEVLAGGKPRERAAARVEDIGRMDERVHAGIPPLI